MIVTGSDRWVACYCLDSAVWRLVIVPVVLDVEFCMETQMRAADDLVVRVGRYGGCQYWVESNLSELVLS